MNTLIINGIFFLKKEPLIETCCLSALHCLNLFSNSNLGSNTIPLALQVPSATKVSTNDPVF